MYRRIEYQENKFYALVKEYKKEPEAFPIGYVRKNVTKKIMP